MVQMLIAAWPHAGEVKAKCVLDMARHHVSCCVPSYVFTDLILKANSTIGGSSFSSKKHRKEEMNSKH